MDFKNSSQREDWILNHLRVVDYLAYKYSRAFPRLFDDLIGEGYLALCTATDQFDDKRGIRFETYAFVVIERFLWKLLDRECLIKLSPQVRLAISNLNKLSDQHMDLNDSRLAYYLGVSPDLVAKVRFYEMMRVFLFPDLSEEKITSNQDQCLGLDIQEEEEEGERIRPIFHQSYGESAESIVLSKMMVEESLASLGSTAAKRYAKLYLIDGLNPIEIAEKCGVSKQTVYATLRRNKLATKFPHGSNHRQKSEDPLINMDVLNQAIENLS